MHWFRLSASSACRAVVQLGFWSLLLVDCMYMLMSAPPPPVLVKRHAAFPVPELRTWCGGAGSANRTVAEFPVVHAATNHYACVLNADFQHLPLSRAQSIVANPDYLYLMRDGPVCTWSYSDQRTLLCSLHECFFVFLVASYLVLLALASDAAEETLKPVAWHGGVLRARCPSYSSSVASPAGAEISLRGERGGAD